MGIGIRHILYVYTVFKTWDTFPLHHHHHHHHLGLCCTKMLH